MAAVGSIVLVRLYTPHGFDRPGAPWDSVEYPAIVTGIGGDPNILDLAIFPQWRTRAEGGSPERERRQPAFGCLRALGNLAGAARVAPEMRAPPEGGALSSVSGVPSQPLDPLRARNDRATWKSQDKG
jgi:hypothetical protein